MFKPLLPSLVNFITVCRYQFFPDGVLLRRDRGRLPLKYAACGAACVAA